MDRITQIEQLLAQSPTDVFLNYALAMEYLSVSDIQKTIAQLEKVKSIQVDYLPLYYQLAKAYEANSDSDAAIKTYEEGILIAQQTNERKTLGELRSALEELTF